MKHLNSIIYPVGLDDIFDVVYTNWFDSTLGPPLPPVWHVTSVSTVLTRFSPIFQVLFLLLNFGSSKGMETHSSADHVRFRCQQPLFQTKSSGTEVRDQCWPLAALWKSRKTR